MERRNFLINSTIASIPLMMSGFPLRTFASPIHDKMAKIASNSDRVLVLIQLNGGNDGLNTLIPLDQYESLVNARENILIPEKSVLKLNDVSGFHPVMNGIKELYEDGKAGVVQGVGYPDPNLSHFRSTDIWTSASDSDKVISSGWLGRYLYDDHPDYPEGYPNDSYPDPLSITIGPVISHTCQGLVSNMGMALNSSSTFYEIGGGYEDKVPESPAGDELAYIRQIIKQTELYTDVIIDAAGKVTLKSDKFPADGTNSLADQLKIVSILIAGGLQTKVYVVSLGGFDTHSLQITGEPGSGIHADLLSKVSEAVYAFQDELKLQGAEDKVLTMTFSEFGRRILSNFSFGTDHGTSAPLFIFGSNVNPVIHGSNPVIPIDVSPYDNLPMQYDFRSVYYSILKGWFEVETDDAIDIMQKEFQYIPIVRGPNSVENYPALNGNISCYPNPAISETNIKFGEVFGHITINIFDNTGKRISRIYRGAVNPQSEMRIELNNYNSGKYFIQVQNETSSKIIPLVIRR